MLINQEWNTLLGDIILMGSDVTCRGFETKELIANSTRIDMSCPILTVPQRKISPRFLAGEAYWILSGSNRVSDISKYLPGIAKYSDNGLTFRGAYGPKVMEQLDYMVHALRHDAESRQAVLTIWRENPMPSKDIPCTVSLQWVIRDNKLCCIANMRSSDAWMGWVYDVFNFSMISAWIAIYLRQHELKNLELGTLYLNAGSQHIYKHNSSDAIKLVNNFKPNSICRPIELERYCLGPDELLLDLKAAADNEWKACTPFMEQLRTLNNET